MNERYWFFNTDQTEREGEDAYLDMLDFSVIAAWGDCRGTDARKRSTDQQKVKLSFSS